MLKLDEEESRKRLNGSSNLLNRLHPNKNASPNLGEVPAIKQEPILKQESNLKQEPNSEQDSISAETPAHEQPPEIPAQNLNPVNPVKSENKPKKKVYSSLNVAARPPGIRGVPPDHEKRLIAGILGNIMPKQTAERLTGIDRNTIIQAARGNSVKGKPDEELRERLRIILPQIQDLAIDKLFKAGGLINDETLKAIPDKEKALTSSVIMKNMAQIIERLTPKEGVDKGLFKDAKVLIMTSEQKSEQDYEVVDGTVSRIE